MKVIRVLAWIVLVLLVILAAVGVAWGYTRYILVLVLGVGALFLFVSHPETPMTVFYPLIWLYWSYITPWLGGRLERAIGVLAIAGVALILLSRRQNLERLPAIVFTGLALLFGSNVISGMINFTPSVQASLVSLVTRLLFLYLAYFLLHTSQQLRLASWLLITSGLVGAVIILFINLRWGMGFFRTTQGAIMLQASLGPFWYSLLEGGNSLTFPAVLLLGIYPTLRKPLQRFLVLAGAVFLFAMAFFAQFRREILITVGIVLLYLIVTNFGSIRWGTLVVLVFLAIFYLLVLQPSAIFQQRLAETAMVSQGTDPRLMTLEVGLQVFIKSPIIGWGPGNYERASSTVLGPSLLPLYYHSYNVFMYFAVESGLLGLGGLLLTLLGVFRQVRQPTVDPGSTEGWILRSAPIILLVIIISYLFGNYYDMSLPWFLMGLMLSAARLTKTSLQEGCK